MHTYIYTHTHTHTKTAKDTATSAMTQAINRYHERIGDFTALDKKDYVLKVTGYREYMEGQHLLLDYKYVRTALRNGDELHLKLVKRPTPRVKSQEELKLPDPVELYQVSCLSVQFFQLRCLCVCVRMRTSDLFVFVFLFVCLCLYSHCFCWFFAVIIIIIVIIR